MAKFRVGEGQSIRRDTVTDHVYEVIRNQIMSLALKPTQILSEKDFSAELGVSRTPIREAFIRLQREGLLDIYPQRGTYVSQISMSRIKEERFIREILERAIFIEYMKNPSEKSIAQMQYYINMEKHAYQEQDYYAALQYDNAFHGIAYIETNNLLSHHIIETNSIDYRRARLFSILDHQGIIEVNAHQHEELCEAVITRDLLRALNVLQLHLTKIDAEMEYIMETNSQYFTD